MLARRISRDTKERGRSVEGILEQYAILQRFNVVAYVRRYLRYVKPAFENSVQPSARHADIVSIWSHEPPCPTN